MRVLGLMSGTSADGVDAVLAEFKGHPHKPKWELINHAFVAYSGDLQTAIVQAGQGKTFSSSDWLELAEAITEYQAQAAQTCDPMGVAELIGCHGQTLWHRPPNASQRGSSWQVLQGPLLAELLHRPVVHDFRAVDLALNGHGAPLVPMADAAILGRIRGWRAVLNLGGIANLTLIPPFCGPEQNSAVMGWDTGPANSLIDLAIRRFSQGQLTFDEDGAMASQGQPHERTIQTWLEEDYFRISPPKSTGRELFGLIDTNRRLKDLKGLKPTDQLATLTAFTAAVIAQDLNLLFERDRIRPVELVSAGGGSRNLTLMRELRSRCRGIRLRLSHELGLPSEAREAMAFALLAWWHTKGIKGNAPEVTGAKHAAVLGVLAAPSGRIA